jgi:drug/metabolite transporter (DMT)-like permease
VRTLAALAVAVVGFALVTGPGLDGGARATGILWAAASGLMLVVLVLTSKPLAEVYGGARLTLIELLGAGLALLPVGVAVDWSAVDAGAWAALVVLGLVHTGLGISVYLAALAEVPATHTGILGYLEPVAVVILAWAVLGDAPTVPTVVGGALIIAAGSSVVLGADRLPSRPEVPARVPG